MLLEGGERDLQGSSFGPTDKIAGDPCRIPGYCLDGVLKIPSLVTVELTETVI